MVFSLENCTLTAPYSYCQPTHTVLIRNVTSNSDITLKVKNLIILGVFKTTKDINIEAETLLNVGKVSADSLSADCKKMLNGVSSKEEFIKKFIELISSNG